MAYSDNLKTLDDWIAEAETRVSAGPTGVLPSVLAEVKRDRGTVDDETLRRRLCDVLGWDY